MSSDGLRGSQRTEGERSEVTQPADRDHNAETGRHAQIRARLDAATQGEWFYDSYSRVFAADYVQRHEDAWEQAPSQCDFPRTHRCTDCVDHKCQSPVDLYEAESEVCSVPTIAGDTATRRHSADAVFIAAAPADVAHLLAEVDRLTQLGNQLADALDRLRRGVIQDPQADAAAAAWRDGTPEGDA